MTGRFLFAVLLALSLVGQILGQTISITTSITTSISISGSNSISGSTSVSGSTSYSTTGSYSTSASYTNSISPPVPAAPINLTNSFPTCALRPDGTNHINYLCLSWSDPTRGSIYWLVSYSPVGSIPSPVKTTFPFLYLSNLTAGTAYTISIVGVNAAGTKSAPLIGSGAKFTTDPTDAKSAYKTKDLQNVNCSNGVTTGTYRKVINCQWGSPPVLPSNIEVKARCVATGSKNKVLHRSLKGSAVSVVLPIHRSLYSCYVEIFGIYLNHKANNGHGHKFVLSCSSTTGCVRKN